MCMYFRDHFCDSQTGLISTVPTTSYLAAIVMLILSVVLFYFLTTLTPVQRVAATATNEVLIKPPENQYILEDKVATLTCVLQGAQIAFWSINGENTTDHDNHRSYYRELGVTFHKSNVSNNFNLTMTVPANLSFKVNNIRCIAMSTNRHLLAMSDNVRIFVFKSFSPPPPLITVDVDFHPLSLYITIKGEPLWPNYEISEFRVNITNTTSGSLLRQMTATKNSFVNDTVRLQIVNESLLTPAVSQSYLLMISVSAVSPLYNESKPNQTSVLILEIQGGESDPDASLYMVAMGIFLGIALLLLSAFSILVVGFCIYYQRTRQQGVHTTGNSLPNQACNTNRRMVTNPIYDPGQVYDSIDPAFYSMNDGSPVQAMPRYSYSPNHNVSSLDTVPRIQETTPMTYNTTVHTSSSVTEKNKRDRNKLHLTLPGVPGSDSNRVDHASTEAGCVNSEEGLYVEMSQSGTLSRQEN